MPPAEPPTGFAEPPTGFAERAADARGRHGPLVLGLDPSAAILQRWGLPDSPEGLARFAACALDAAAGSVGFAKPQVAFFERHGWEGMRVLQQLIVDLRAAGVLVIVDAKRGDVDSTNEAYAQAYLGPGAPFAADALTVHPYLGVGAMDAFVRRADDSAAGLFVVTRSSNPQGRTLQTARTGTGRSVEAQILRELGELNARLAPGRVGPVGAVVGATHDTPELDLTGANGLFLAPGLGAQGAGAADVARTFAPCPERVLPAASRAVLAEGPEPRRVRDAARLLNAELVDALGG